MAKEKYNKQQEEAILNYAKQIDDINTFAEACRKMPGMYLGSRGSRGWLNMMREIYQNAIDQIVMKGGIGNNIIFTYDELLNIATCQDDGLGIPHGEIIRIFTHHHTSKNYKKQPFDWSAGLHGSGAKGSCACSEFFEVESYVLGKGKYMRFEKGIPVFDKEQVIKNQEIYQGTKIRFKVDETIMGDCQVPYEIVYDLFTTMISMTKLGAKLVFNCMHKDGSMTSTTFINEDGIIFDLIKKTEKPLIKPVMISYMDPDGIMAIDTAFTYGTEGLSDEDISTFANWSPTVGGTHLNGFVDGLTKFFRDYMNKIFLKGGKKELNILSRDVLGCLKAIVHCKHLYPDMKGQSKEELSNPDMYTFMKEAILKGLEEWSKSNASDLQKVCKFIKQMAEERIKLEKGKEKIINNYNTKSVIDIPDKLSLAPSRDKKARFEFWIVEGDSAGGSAKKARNPFQHILAIRGKMPNAFSTPRAKFFNNDEVKAYYATLRAEPGKNFRAEDVRKAGIDKVIIGADGDVDGKHITTLVLQMNLLYSLELIEEGMLYRSVPPLFGVVKGKDMVYYTDSIDYLRYVQSVFSKSNVVMNAKGTIIDNKELEYIIHVNVDYTYCLEKVANNYSIDPLVLEDILLNKDKSFNDLYKTIHKKYKYLEIDKLKGTSRIKGLVNDQINTVYINDRFNNELNILDKFIKNNQFSNFNLNGEMVTLYQFMKSFEACKPKTVQRYKGLGEMNPNKLYDSTMDPDNRTLVQYTVASAKEEIERIRYLESNKYELVQGKSTTRSGL